MFDASQMMQTGKVEHGEKTNNKAGGLCYITVPHPNMKNQNQLLPFHGDPEVFVNQTVEFFLTPERFVRAVKLVVPLKIKIKG